MPITTIDEYLATVSDEQRVALEKIRKTIRAAVPKAEECIDYGVAAFRWNGKALAGFGAAAKHCSYYPMSGSIVAAHQAELANFKTTKGSVQFPPGKPLAAALIRRLLKARMSEITG